MSASRATPHPQGKPDTPPLRAPEVDQSTRLTAASIDRDDAERVAPLAPPAPTLSADASAGAHATTPGWTDAEIVAVLAAAEVSDAREIKLARAKAKSARVAHFSADLLLDGRASAATRASIEARIAPSSCAASSEIDLERTPYVLGLEGADGSQFDRRFVLSQVRQGESMLKLLDDALLPNAKDPALKDYLHALRSRTLAHLLAAREIDNQLP